MHISLTNNKLSFLNLSLSPTVLVTVASKEGCVLSLLVCLQCWEESKNKICSKMYLQVQSWKDVYGGCAVKLQSLRQR